MPTSRTSTPRIADRAFNSSNPFDSASDSDEESTTENDNLRIKHYESDLRECGGFSTQSVHDLENYAVYKAKKTTEKIDDCLKIAEDIKEDAAKILVTLNQQGEQISRTHLNVVNVDHDLSRGEKLLSSLGGFFSRSWKPTRSSPIRGPAFSPNNDISNRLGYSSGSIQSSAPRRFLSESKSTLGRVEVEKVKQNDKLSDLSDLLGQLKDMAVDMGTEIERQNSSLCDLHDDVDSISSRVNGANSRARRLLGK